MSAERLSRKYHHSPRPPLVESESRQQISLCQVENAQLHATRVAFRRSLRLATCQSENSALSSRTSRSVSRRATPCRPGEATSASSRLRSAQSASIARSLSSRDIRLIANVIPTSIIWSIKCPPARPNRRTAGENALRLQQPHSNSPEPSDLSSESLAKEDCPAGRRFAATHFGMLPYHSSNAAKLK